MLNKRIFFQKFTARGQSIGQNLCAVRFAKMGLFKNSKHIVFASIQRREIQRLQAFFCKRKLFLLCGSEWFGWGIGQGVDFGGKLVKPQAGAAVKNWCKAHPFQRYRVTNRSKIAEMPILIADQIVQNHHLLQLFRNIRDTQFFAAVKEMRIGTYAVPAGKSRKNIITTDKIMTVGRHISADGIRLATLKQQAILHMWDSQLAAEQGCCCLIERFLLRHAAAAFYQYALAVQYLPFFLQPAVGGVAGGNEINAVPLRNLPKQDIADILRKIVMVEVDLAPFQGLLCRIEPVLIGQT